MGDVTDGGKLDENVACAAMEEGNSVYEREGFDRNLAADEVLDIEGIGIHLLAESFVFPSA